MVLHLQSLGDLKEAAGAQMQANKVIGKGKEGQRDGRGEISLRKVSFLTNRSEKPGRRVQIFLLDLIWKNIFISNTLLSSILILNLWKSTKIWLMS